MVLKAFPTRKEMIRIFYYGEDGPEKLVFEAVEIYLTELDSNLNVIVKMYREWSLEDNLDQKESIEVKS